MENVLEGIDVPLIRFVAGISEAENTGDLELQRKELLLKAGSVYRALLSRSADVVVNFIPGEEGEEGGAEDPGLYRVIMTRTVLGVPVVVQGDVVGSIHMREELSQKLNDADGTWFPDEEFGTNYTALWVPDGEDAEESELFSIFPATLRGASELSTALDGSRHENTHYNEHELLGQSNTILDRMLAELG